MADRDGDEQHAEEGVVERTEHLADEAIERLRQEVHLPDVREEAARAREFVRAIRSWFLRVTIALYGVAAAVGIWVAVSHDLHDWSMHAAFYGILLGFLFVYVKAYLQRRLIARSFYALLTAGLMGFFAWVLMDLVPARLVARGLEAVRRPEIPELYWPAALLATTAALVLVHWLFLSRRKAANP